MSVSWTLRKRLSSVSISIKAPVKAWIEKTARREQADDNKAVYIEFYKSQTVCVDTSFSNECQPLANPGTSGIFSGQSLIKCDNNRQLENSPYYPKAMMPS